MLDGSTEFGARAARRLTDDKLAWLTTVSQDGTPQPVPVWFLWDGADSILLYSRPGTPKLHNVERSSGVSLHLDGDGLGGDIVVCLGEACVSDDPPAHELPEYVAKYTWGFERNGWSAEEFSSLYSVPLRIALRRIRGH
ncbi:MAG: TIGR03667 family PPOX class F420-dependent oxidoreductase [Candidatus Rokuibacteriota bacterium]|nr:MAG: TIGR03667 family PPOX class F420-dependent oxidoreductase [Candidatus Rokubacteria bacterium]